MSSRFVDLPSLSAEASWAVRRCLDSGVSHLLLSPLPERLSRARELLQVELPTAGEELNVRLLLRSLDNLEVGLSADRCGGKKIL